MDHSRPLFLYFCLFNTVYSKMLNKKFCRWRNSNGRPLELEATTTVPSIYFFVIVITFYKFPYIKNVNDEFRVCLSIQKYNGGGLGCRMFALQQRRPFTVEGRIAVQLIFCLYSIVVLQTNNNLFLLFCIIQTSKTRDQPSSDPSIQSECSLFTVVVSSVTRLGEISPLGQHFKCIWANVKSFIYNLAKLWTYFGK